MSRVFTHAFSALLVCLLATQVTAQKPKFKDATLPPLGGRPSASKSINGKSIPDMKKKVEAMWGDIVFKKDGKPIDYLVTLKTDAGDIQIEFFPDLAPNHVRSFLALTAVGYFDGLIFHRVIPGFVIQGGCPLGSGSGGPGYCLKAEFSKKKHERGILSMARTQVVDSAGSQFFICVERTEPLDNKYTVFGRVVKGMEVVDKIVSADRDRRNDRPNKPVKIKSAKLAVKGK